MTWLAIAAALLLAFWLTWTAPATQRQCWPSVLPECAGKVR